MLSSTLLGHYVPVTWLSFALDYVLWGCRPFGFHLTNIVLHEITASLVCILTTRLLARATAWPAATCAFGGVAAALPWGLHPLRVEAVSWATGRRDVLSAFLLCLALGAWLIAIDREGSSRRRWLSAAVAAYALALGAKSVVMMTPPAMVALDVYPLRRLPLDVRRWHAPTVRAVWLEKIPFAMLAVLAAAATAIAVPRGIGYEVLGVRAWLGKALVSLALPAWKTMVPLSLSPLYEFPRWVDFTTPRFWGERSVPCRHQGVVALRRRGVGDLVGWLWYVLFLMPVSLMAHAGPQLVADRYAHLPTLGLLVPLGAALAATHRRWTGVGGWALRLGVAAVILTLAVLTWAQEAVWHDTGSLWAHGVKVTPDCAVCQGNMGHLFSRPTSLPPRWGISSRLSRCGRSHGVVSEPGSRARGARPARRGDRVVSTWARAGPGRAFDPPLAGVCAAGRRASGRGDPNRRRRLALLRAGRARPRLRGRHPASTGGADPTTGPRARLAGPREEGSGGRPSWRCYAGSIPVSRPSWPQADRRESLLRTWGGAVRVGRTDRGGWRVRQGLPALARPRVRRMGRWALLKHNHELHPALALVSRTGPVVPPAPARS